MSMTLSIALAYLRERKRQSVLSILGVMMGVAFFVGISGLMQGMHTYFIEKLVDVAPHVKILDEYREPQIQPVFTFYNADITELRGIKPKEELRGIRQAEKIVAALQIKAGIKVTPTLNGQVFLRYGGKDVSSTLVGIDPETERMASNLERDMVEGNLNNLLTNSSGIIVGKDLANKLSLRMGAKLSVISPAGIIKKMKVVGIFESGLSAVDSGTSYAILKKAQILQEREDVINQINIRMRNVDEAPELAREIENQYGYRTESWQETFANIFQFFVVQNAIMYSTVTAILLVAGFGIYNTISASVNEKTHDIAILKSMGFSQNDISLIFLYQGVIVGLIGSVLGCLMGNLLLDVLASVDIKMKGETLVSFEGFPVYRSNWLYVAGSLMAFTSASVSAYIPARKAASYNPVEIIRGAS